MESGSARPGRVGQRVLNYVVSKLNNPPSEVKATFGPVTVLDPIELKLPILEKPHFFYRGDDKAPDSLEAAAQAIKNADCYVLISSEYNHAPAPGLLNILNHFGGSLYKNKPSAIITYSPGPYGGMRAVTPFSNHL